jgi:negative regulator of flagellin synthesis FlgM
MVEAVGSKSAIETKAVTRVAATPVPAAPEAVAKAPARTAQDVAVVGQVASTLAKSAPVDTDRVATIKKAIADGKFPILPATIADRMIALKLNWDGHEQA